MEFSLLMIVLVPLLLYGIFLMDVPHMKLETQETALASVWDYTTRNHQEIPGHAGTHSTGDPDDVLHVGKTNSFVWADHTSAVDDGVDPNLSNYGVVANLHGESPHSLHHTGFGAQYAFNFSGGPDTQLDCNMTNRDTGDFDPTDWTADLAWVNNPAFSSFAGSSLARGGLGQCECIAYIYNYIVPQKFLQEFSRVDMTRMKMREGIRTGGGGTAHNWQGDTSPIANIQASEKYAVGFGTWALRNGAANGDIDDADLRQPPMSNPLMRGVREANTAGPLAVSAAAVTTAAGVLSAQAASNEVIVIPVGTSVAGLPNATGQYLQARFEPNAPPPDVESPGWWPFGNEDYESMPYDDVNPDYATAKSARGPFYMGCPSAESYPCP